MKMSNRVYDILKWCVITVIPALITLYGVIGTTCGIPHTNEVITIASAVDACLGTCLGISSVNYAASKPTVSSEMIDEVNGGDEGEWEDE